MTRMDTNQARKDIFECLRAMREVHIDASRERVLRLFQRRKLAEFSLKAPSMDAELPGRL